MGDRGPGASAVIGEGSVESPRCEPVPAATLRQLQHGGGLVSVKLADHYRELAGAIKQVGFADRRRHRQDFPDRRPADKCFATGLRLSAVANRWTEMGRARPTAIPFSTVGVQLDE